MLLELVRGTHTDDDSFAGSENDTEDKHSINRRKYMGLSAATFAAVVSTGLEPSVVSGQTSQTYTTDFSEYAS